MLEFVLTNSLIRKAGVSDEETGQRRRKKKGGGDDGSEYSYESDGQGGVRKVRKKKDDDEESIYEYVSKAMNMYLGQDGVYLLTWIFHYKAISLWAFV